MSHTYTREQLIELCNKAVVAHEDWRDRDSSSAQRQVGELLALLRAGCPFEVVQKGDWATDERTIVVLVTFHGFSKFEDGEDESETFYLPTESRLIERVGSDWY